METPNETRPLAAPEYEQSAHELFPISMSGAAFRVGVVGRCGVSARGGSTPVGSAVLWAWAWSRSRYAWRAAWRSEPTRGTTRRCTRPPTASAFARSSLQPTLPAAGELGRSVACARRSCGRYYDKVKK